MTKTIAEYIWIDANNGLRSKCKVFNLDYELSDVQLSHFPEWNYDGSSTGQASGSDSEVIIKPRCLFNDPFRGSNNYLVMCDTYTPDGDPHKTNMRNWANNLFNF